MVYSLGGIVGVLIVLLGAQVLQAVLQTSERSNGTVITTSLMWLVGRPSEGGPRVHPPDM